MNDDNAAAKPTDPESTPPAETEAKASPEKAPVKPAVKPPLKAAARPPVKGAKPPLKAAVKTAPDKPARPPVEKQTEPEEKADARPNGEPAAEADDKPAEEKPADEAAVQAEKPAKGKKKKPKADTGVTTKPGLSSFFNFSKPPPAGVWGVDLGQCALKAIRLEIIDGEVAATAFDYVEHPKILSQPDADPDELTREALQKFLSRNSLRGDTVAISVPGQSGLARFVKLPPVEEKKIPDIVRFEAKQQIPFNLEEVVWDYQKLGVGELAAGFVETEIGLFAMKRDMVNRYLQHFKDVGVEVHLVQMAPLALCNFVSYDLLGRDVGANGEEGGRPRKRCVTALDIGADSSNLVITDGGRIIWQRPIPLGGNHFTRALTKDLKLTFAKAEHLKRNAVKSPDLKKILASLKPVLSDFVGEVQRSLGYFTNTHRDAQIDYMVGLGNAFRLPGLQRYLAEKLQMEVRKLSKMERLAGDSVVNEAAYTENILSFAVAYGLALQGLKRTKLQTNLLPGEIRTERAVRGKKPWAVAAAGLLLFGIGTLGFSGFLNYQSYAAQPVLLAVTKATDVAKTAGDNESKFDAAKKSALDEEAAVRSIIAGQAERRNWLELTHFLFTDAIPRPDATNLSDDAKKQYFTGPGKTMTGEQAFKAMEEHQQTAAPKPPPKDKDTAYGPPGGMKPAEPAPADVVGPGIDDLVQVNIEFFDQRYTDDMGAAWANLKKQDHIFGKDNPAEVDAKDMAAYVRTADLNKPPVGKGWVVEIHGYTYHNEARTFLANTLLDNIYRLSVKPGTAPPPAPGAPAPGGTPPAAPMGQTGTPNPDAGGATTEPPFVINEPKDAYWNHISHVALFDAKDSSQGSIVGQSVLDALVRASSGTGPMGLPAGGTTMGASAGALNAPGAGASTPGGMNQQGGAGATPTRDSWSPLSPFMKTGGGGQGSNGFSTPGGASSGSSAPNPFGSTDSGKTTRPAVAGHTRTEFIVVFFWKEQTPSDKLRGEDEKPKPAPAAAQPNNPPPSNTPTPPPPAKGEDETPSIRGGLKDI